MSPDSARTLLEGQGIKIDSMNQVLRDIAAANELSPADLYGFFGRSDTEVEKKRQGAVIIRGGNGIGRKSLQQIGDEYGIPPEDLVNALKKEGFKAGEEDILKDIADEYGVSPSEILDILNNRDGK